MNRLLSWLIVLGLAVGISACDKKEGVPLPKTGTGELKQQAKEAVGAVENAAKKEKVAGGAPDKLENLRPFHWRNHFDIAGNKSHCQVKADRADVPAGEYARPPRNRGV
jgi:hypothetical protein